ncbi:MAG TPA: hypothetical protein VEN28_10475 [Burkholderiaceae bacterium]|nr:hypothetical protein [Burkholderiaceae bacterium]
MRAREVAPILALLLAFCVFLWALVIDRPANFMATYWVFGVMAAALLVLGWFAMRAIKPANDHRAVRVLLVALISFVGAFSLLVAVSSLLAPVDVGFRGLGRFIMDPRGWYVLVLPAVAIALAPLVAGRVLGRRASSGG